jgi:hypothetical protein
LNKKGKRARIRHKKHKRSREHAAHGARQSHPALCFFADRERIKVYPQAKICRAEKPEVRIQEPEASRCRKKFGVMSSKFGVQ